MTLSTPLMLCIAQDKIEMFIYILYSFKQHFIKYGHESMDINGNSLLHLAALNQNHNNSINFSKIIMKFSPDRFMKMINLKNNDGNTPLYIAAGLKNIKLMMFLMQNSVKPATITLKNKNGETLKEFIERYSGATDGTDTSDLLECYNISENRILVQAILGRKNYKS